MNSDYITILEQMIERHLPVGFIDYLTLQKIINVLQTNKKPTRREILIMAYLLGTDSSETDNLLLTAGHSPLYVKKREDAIWKFVLDCRIDSASVVEEIFSQNADDDTEKSFSTEYPEAKRL